MEPLTLPASGWLLQGQVITFLISIIIFSLLLSLSLTNHLYTSLTVVLMIVMMQQSVQLVLTWIHSTDIGLCCPGVSVIRWFIYQDFYTQVRGDTFRVTTSCPCLQIIQSVVVKRFRGSPQSREEWFSIDQEATEPCSQLDRAGEIRLLQSLLESVHSLYYRQVFPGHESLASLVLTHQEMEALSQHFRLEDQSDEENVIYTAETPQ